MPSDNKSHATKSTVVQARDDQSEWVVLCVRQAEFNRLLEQSLSSWRMPHWENILSLLLTAFIIPGVFALFSIKEGSIERIYIIIIVFCCIFSALGIMFGRWLRPRPSQDEINAFSAKTQSLNECKNYILESRELANKLGPVNRSTVGNTSPSLEPKFCVVDYLVIKKFNLIANELQKASLSSDSNFGYGVAPTIIGNRAYYSKVVECAECGKSFDIDSVKGSCVVCGRPFCEKCEISVSDRFSSKDGNLRCRACRSSNLAEVSG